MKILLVDDDSHIREMVLFALEKAGFQTAWAATQTEAKAILEKSEFDLLLLDINLPDGNGFEICKWVRKTNQVPIIFLTCNDEEVDKIVAFEIGGDDYVTKPFSPRELVARIRAIQRRVQPIQEQEQPTILSVGHLVLNLDSCIAEYHSQKINLTVTEFELLRAMMRYPQKVYSRAELVQTIYKGQFNVTERTVDTHIRRIRKKFEPHAINPIVTVPGFGYQVSPCEN